MTKAPQLAVVGIALVLVLTAGGYGIAQGILADDERPTIATTWKSATTCGTGSDREVPVANTLPLPTRLPEGVCLDTAYYSAGAPATLWYSNEQRDKVFVVAFIEAVSPPAFSSPTGTPIQLGNLVGHATDETNPDGTGLYSIGFEKSGWTYVVSARFGKNGDLPDNTVTPVELNAVALSMAEQ